MKSPRFETDCRLWLWTSLVLFAVLWCFVRIDIKGETFRPVVLLWEWVGYLVNSEWREAFGVGVMLFIFGFMSSIVAVPIAWPLHALIVVVRQGLRGTTSHDA